MKQKVAVIGASGYAGMEAVKLLAGHPFAELVAVSSKSYTGKHLSSLMGASAPDMVYCDLEAEQVFTADVIMACLPHCHAMERVKEWRGSGKTVIDLSADFRLENHENFEEWYGRPHTAEKLLTEAVFGLPEINRESLKTADLIACPGCYPTAGSLAALPALKAGIVEPNIIVNAVSGVSGAGRQANEDYSFCERNENMQGYGAPTHRHTPEIEQALSKAVDGGVKVTFVPHLGPFNRGIYATVYATLKNETGQEEIEKIYRDFYSSEPFVAVCEENPQLKNVVNTNYCHLRPVADGRTGRLIVFSSIDNLVKGAAGQAVQCFNIRFGFPEKSGL